MAAKIVSFAFLFLLLFSVLSYGQIVNEEREIQRKLYEEIFWRYKDLDISHNEILAKRVFDYMDFTKKYPDSEFVPEAYLRIAEFSQIIGKKVFARRFLDAIIKNYPDDSYYSLVSHDYTGEKTSGWALYWRAVWFKEKTAKNDLERIIKKNPADSQVVHDAKIELDRLH